MPAKVLLVDDHTLFTEGLQYLLKTHGFKIVGIAKNGREGFQKACELAPDIVLMDIFMPECGGLESLQLIKARMPRVKVVILTTSEEDGDLFEAIKLGASGYLLKSLNSAELVAMINGLQEGEVPLSPGLAARLLREFRRSARENPAAFDSGKNTAKVLPGIVFPGNEPGKGTGLTGRQVQVLEQVAQGKSYRETGKALGLTERTIKYHMARIIELLHLENRAQVIAFAAKKGLVDLESD